MKLRESLMITPKGSRTMAEYLQFVKLMVDELAHIDTRLSDDEITSPVLNNIGVDNKDIANSI